MRVYSYDPDIPPVRPTDTDMKMRKYAVAWAVTITALLPSVALADEIRNFLQAICAPEPKIFEVRVYPVRGINDTDMFERNEEGKRTPELNQAVLDKYGLLETDTPHIECTLPGHGPEKRPYRYEFRRVLDGYYELWMNGELKITEINFGAVRASYPIIHSIRIIGDSWYGNSYADVFYHTQKPGGRYELLIEAVFFEGSWRADARVLPKTMKQIIDIKRELRIGK